MDTNANKNLVVSVLIIILVLAGGVVLYNANKTRPAGNKNIITDSLTVGLAVGSMKSEAFGEYLTDTKGMTLYTFAGDKRSISNCAGDCLKMWPAFMYDDKDLQSATDLPSKRMKVIKRSDGRSQYAYGFQPVYYYFGDVNPGDMKGNGLGGKWSIVKIQ